MEYGNGVAVNMILITVMVLVMAFLLVAMLFTIFLSMVIMSIVDNRRLKQNRPPRPASNVKRFLILAAAIVSFAGCGFLLPICMLIFFSNTGYTYPIILLVLFVFKLVSGICLVYSIRNKGQFMAKSYHSYILGIIFATIGAGFVSWLLLFISVFCTEPKQCE